MTTRCLTKVVAALVFCAVTNKLDAQRPSFPTEDDLRGKTAGDLATRRGEYRSSVADWGFLLAPENRKSEDSSVIRIAVLRQRAKERATGSPIFNLVGGPGKSNVWGSGNMPSQLLVNHDIVRMGYRGVDSNVELTCPEFSRSLQSDAPLSKKSILGTRAALRECNDRLRNKGVDIDGYTLAETVKDIEDVRAGFGYEKISFLAVSWGTQLAYSYAMQYPTRVDRMVWVGAGGRARGFNVWTPSIIDKKIQRLGELWKKAPAAAARCADIVVTIRKVLASLPVTWRGHRIDRGKVLLSTYYMLDAGVETAAQVLDAYAAAGNGDYAGVAYLSMAYDEDVSRRLNKNHGPYDGEFFSKVMSSGFDANRNYITDMDPADSIIGSPAAKLLWGAASNGGWPIASISKDLCEDKDIETRTLVLMGDLDFSSPHEYVQTELMPHLKRGDLVLISNMGHDDVAKLQRPAFEHLLVRFFRDGVIEANYETHSIGFSPTKTLKDEANRIVPRPNGAR